MNIDELHAARREVLLKLADGKPRGVFAESTGLSSTTLPRLLSEPDQKGHKAIGDEVALRIEGRLDLDPGALVFPERLRAAAGDRLSPPPSRIVSLDRGGAQETLGRLRGMVGALAVEQRLLVVKRLADYLTEPVPDPHLLASLCAMIEPPSSGKQMQQ